MARSWSRRNPQIAASVARTGFWSRPSSWPILRSRGCVDKWLDLRTAGISKLDPSTPREPHRIYSVLS